MKSPQNELILKQLQVIEMQISALSFNQVDKGDATAAIARACDEIRAQIAGHTGGRKSPSISVPA